MKGVYVSLSDGDVASYEVALDAQGKELSRTRLGPAPLQWFGCRSRGPARRRRCRIREASPSRIRCAAALCRKPAAPPAGGPAAPPGAGGGGRGGRGDGRRPALRANDWNTVQMILDSDVVGLALNGGRGGGRNHQRPDDGLRSPGALRRRFCEVRFKEVSYKDLNSEARAQGDRSPRISQMQRINDFYYAWCAAAADINRDGVMDVIAGPSTTWGPTTPKARDHRLRTYNPSNQFAQAW